VAASTRPTGGRVLWRGGPDGRVTTLLVTGGTARHPRVRLPVRPTGTEGFVDGTRVRLRVDPWRVRVDLRRRRLTAFRAGRAVLSAPVAVGRPATPTPRGRFFVTAVQRPPRPDTVYGSLAFELSGFSAVFRSFNGGEGQIGIHGTNDPGAIGGRVSAGCIRVRNAVVEALGRRLPLGTPVDVG
jgi:lipoprotein-anchoring transpeptidase ErfK/SrfK